MARRSKTKKTYASDWQANVRGTNAAMDKKRWANKPGKRVSASGKTYYEYRVNRSDLKGDRPSAGSRGLKKKVITKTSSAGKRYKSYVWVRPKSKRKR